jgi:hypothetical protein
MWPFTQKPFLDRDDEEWQIDTWRCFMRHLGGLADLKRSPLVFPTRDFFPPTDATGYARADHMLEAVKRHARMAERISSGACLDFCAGRVSSPKEAVA